MDNKNRNGFQQDFLEKAFDQFAYTECMIVLEDDVGNEYCDKYELSKIDVSKCSIGRLCIPDEAYSYVDSTCMFQFEDFHSDKELLNLLKNALKEQSVDGLFNNSIGRYTTIELNYENLAKMFEDCGFDDKKFLDIIRDNFDYASFEEDMSHYDDLLGGNSFSSVYKAAQILHQELTNITKSVEAIYKDTHQIEETKEKDLESYEKTHQHNGFYLSPDNKSILEITTHEYVDDPSYYLGEDAMSATLSMKEDIAENVRSVLSDERIHEVLDDFYHGNRKYDLSDISRTDAASILSAEDYDLICAVKCGLAEEIPNLAIIQGYNDDYAFLFQTKDELEQSVCPFDELVHEYTLFYRDEIYEINEYSIDDDIIKKAINDDILSYQDSSQVEFIYGYDDAYLSSYVEGFAGPYDDMCDLFEDNQKKIGIDYEATVESEEVVHVEPEADTLDDRVEGAEEKQTPSGQTFDERTGNEEPER